MFLEQYNSILLGFVTLSNNLLFYTYSWPKRKLIMSHKRLMVVLLLSSLAATVLTLGNCPDSCTCLPDLSVIEKCSSISTIPAIDYSNTQELDLSYNQFQSSVLQKSNFTGMSGISDLLLKGCGITHIEYNTFTGKFTQ